MRLFVSCIGVHVRTMRKSRTIPVGVGALDDPYAMHKSRTIPVGDGALDDPRAMCKRYAQTVRRGACSRREDKIGKESGLSCQGFRTRFAPG